MFRTKTCGELTIANVGEVVTLAGWVQKSRKMGGMTFLDMRDRYGITQVVFNEEKDAALCEQANKLGREWVIQVEGTVAERSNKNKNISPYSQLYKIFLRITYNSNNNNKMVNNPNFHWLMNR